jgi:hypothetical protein
MRKMKTMREKGEKHIWREFRSVFRNGVSNELPAMRREWRENIIEPVGMAHEPAVTFSGTVTL